MTSDRVTLISKDPKLPHPRHPPRPDHPVVGNATVEENLAEAVQIAAWTAIGSAKCHLAFEVHAHIVTMSGELASEQQRQTLEGAILHVAGVQSVSNSIKLRAPPIQARGRAAAILVALGTVDVEASPIAFVTRFCSFGEASLSAAIRDAVALLDRAFESQDLPQSGELIVDYFNQRSDTVTLRIAMPSATFAPTSQVYVGFTPAGRVASTSIEAGPDALVEGRAALLQAIVKAGLRPANHCWQHFDATAFRPWAGHPASTLFIPVSDRTSI